MGISNYPHGWPNGVVVRGNPIEIRQAGDSKVFWVDSGTGANGNSGTYLQPFATLNYARSQCAANRGDIIFIAANHAETVATASAIALSVAGITVVGLGYGDDAPTFTFSGTAATIAISANNVRFINCKLVPSVDSVVSPLAITGDDCEVYVESVDASDAVEFVRVILATGVNRGYFNVRHIGRVGGNACVNGIRLNECTDIRIECDFFGKASTAWIEFTDVASSNIYVSGKMFNSGTTNGSKDIIDTITGSTWYGRVEDMSAGAIFSGGSAEAWASDDITAMVTQLTNIQNDIGNPSARTNFQSLETMIGIPDAANSNLDDILRTGFVSSAISANKDGSILEGIKYIEQNMVPDAATLSFRGVCNTGMVASTTTVVVAGLSGTNYPDDFFNTKYYMQVLRNAGTPGGAPEGEVRQITDYVSATGTFTVTAFSGNVEENDFIAVLHESIVAIGRDDANNTFDSTNVVANANGSVLERDQFNQEAIAAIQTDVGNPSARTNFQSIEAMLGIPDAANSNVDDILRTGLDSTAITANQNGSILECIKYIQDNLAPDLQGLVLTGSCDAGMVASATAIVSAHLSGYSDDRFNDKYYMQIIKNANAVGTAPEPEVRLITDYVSATGTFTVSAFSANVEANDIILVLHESLITLGRNDANNTFDSTNVVANANGSVLERDQFNQEAIAVIDGLQDVPAPDAVTNLQMRDVIGNKTDAAAVGAVSGTESIMAYSKQNVTVLGDPSAQTLTTITAKLGNNTTNFAASVGEPDGATTESLHGKLGTDTELADRSLFDILVSAGATSYPAAAAPANDVSLGAVARDTWDVLRNGTGGTEPGANKSIIDALGTNGLTDLASTTSLLYYLQKDIGTVFWVSKTVTSSAITFAAAVDITGAASGTLALEDVIFETNVTGLATGTNLRFQHNDTEGSPIIMEETIANLGAYATVDLDNASVRGRRAIINNNATLNVQSTVANCTGAGTIMISMKFRRMSVGATIAAL